MRLRRLLAIVRLRLRVVFGRARVEQELDEEIRDHIERRVEADVARGVLRDAARQEAFRAFGGTESSKEACRDARGMNLVEHLLQDMRFAARHFGRAPLGTATMIAIFALGIGSSAGLFMFVQAFVNGAVPGIPRHDSLVRIRGIDRTNPGRATGREFSYSEYQDYRAQGSLFTDVAAWTSSDVVFDVGAAVASPQSGAASYVTASYFPVLGLRMALGAGLPLDARDADPATPPVAVISDAMWARHFERSPDVIGRAMKVNGVAVTIVGVAPHRFAGARTGGSQMRVWLPLGMRPLVQRTPPTRSSYDDARFSLVARVQPGVSLEQTGPTVQAIALRAAQAAQPTLASAGAVFSADVVPLRAGNYFPPPRRDEEMSAGPWISMLFPLIVLLITCTNVSALLAGRGVTRQREIALRLALGAGRRRVVRQLMIETLLLAITAAVLALFVIWLLLRLFEASIPDIEIAIERRGVALTFALATIAGLLFGCSPALHATRLALPEALKDASGAGAGRRLHLQSVLVVAQIAFTQPALLAMGALLLEVRSDLAELASQPYADRIVQLHYNVNPRYGALDDERERTIARVAARLAAVPGVDGVVPQEMNDSLDVSVDPADIVPGLDVTSPLQVRPVAAPEGYFPLMGILFVRGRDFDVGDRGQDGAVIIGTHLARRLWGHADAVGRRLVPAGRHTRRTRTFTVIGVVDDETPGVRHGGGPVAEVFMPRVLTTGHLLVRTRGPADQLLPSIRTVAADEAPNLPIVAAHTLAAIEASRRRSVVAAISAAGGAAALALLLSAIGLYALVALAVEQRSREIGVRTALGASTRQVVGQFVRRGFGLGLIGLTIGLGLGLAGARVIAAVEGNDPPAGTLGLAALVAAFVLSVALLASWLPARRAARVDPIGALRAE